MMTGVKCSESYGSNVSANQGEFGEVGPSTLKHVTGSVAKGLVMSLRVVTTPKGEGKGKEKATEKEEKEEEEFVDQPKIPLPTRS
ncbi:hypothetical protein E4T56_gene11019 [Termitomyces sp. T112]|nr:hypothetical protein E4T56_gene11019 [Termitomyces sp. T112]